jgi:hypothetical protein
VYLPQGAQVLTAQETRTRSRTPASWRSAWLMRVAPPILPVS